MNRDFFYLYFSIISFTTISVCKKRAFRSKFFGGATLSKQSEIEQDSQVTPTFLRLIFSSCKKAILLKEC